MTPISLDSMPQRRRAGMLSLRGRIGRARYIAYTLGSLAAAFVFMLPAGYVLLLSGNPGRILYTVVSVLLFYGFLPIFFAVLTVRRAHDFNLGGWLALLLLVPLVNLMFWFIPGTRGDNAYGEQPESPTSGARLAAFILPVLLISAFLGSDGKPVMPQQHAPAVPTPPTSLRPYTP